MGAILPVFGAVFLGRRMGFMRGRKRILYDNSLVLLESKMLPARPRGLRRAKDRKIGLRGVNPTVSDWGRLTL